MRAPPTSRRSCRPWRAIAASRKTHVARRAAEAGAELVAVHGETIAEPVAAGTNRAALGSDYVHALVHPGLLSPELAQLAQRNGKWLELSARRGHSLTNGHVAALARASGTRLLVNSDAHAPGDLLSEPLARRIARGAGLNADETETIVSDNPLELLRQLGRSIPEITQVP